MNILVIGEPVNLEECKAKFGAQHQITFQEDADDIDALIAKSDVVFDFSIGDDPFQIESYSDKQGVTFFINTATISLIQLSNLVNHQINAQLFGFNGIPTFLNRDVLEVSVLNEEDKKLLQEICESLKTKYHVVEDRVGLVTPRIVCMIINEAYYTVQEGTATREDIDQAMKLGTNYPYGPFEWCKKIGVRHVYELLEAVYEDTRDERYKICPLLKLEYLADDQ